MTLALQAHQVSPVTQVHPDPLVDRRDRRENPEKLANEENPAKTETQDHQDSPEPKEILAFQVFQAEMEREGKKVIEDSQDLQEW